MATKVKVFQTSPLNPSGRVDQDLEQQINEWLSDKPSLRIVNVQTTSLVPLPQEKHTSGSVLCLVFYADSTMDGDRRAGFLRD
jgi:hypothetical protein